MSLLFRPKHLFKSLDMNFSTTNISQDLVNLLSSPPPNPITVNRVPFAPTLPEYKSLYAVVLDSVFSPEECTALIQAAEATTPDGQWEPALVNVGNNRQRLITDVRNCGRIIWDDRGVVGAIWSRIRPLLPELERLENWARVTGNELLKEGEVWQLTRLNERMRFLKYGPGQYFRSHCDGTYETPDKRERSYFTLHLYLNDSGSASADGKLEGGATTFHAWNMKEKIDVEPKIGRVLIFQHRSLLHSGEEVVQGLKMTMRTDVMYEKVKKEM